MKTLTFVIAFLLLAVLVTLVAVEDPGYVLLARSPWRIEMSLTVFIALLVVGVLLLNWLYRFLRALWHTPQGVQAWRQYKSLQRAQRAMVQGYLGVLSGDYRKAEQKLLGNMQNHPTPLMNFIAAAYAAQQRGDTAQRDQYLDKAQEIDPDNAFALGLAQARMQFEAGEFEQAAAKCDRLRSRHARHPEVLKLTARLAQHFGNWEELLALIPQLRKQDLFDEIERDEFERQAIKGVFEKTADEHPEGLKKTWQRLTSAQKHRIDNIGIYARVLLRAGRHDEAEHLLRGAIRRQWSDALVYLYGQCESSKPAEQFEIAESWVGEETEENPTLLLTLGRLSIRNKLWGKARSYLEVCVTSAPHEEAFLIYGQLLEQLGEKEHAMEVYRLAVEADYAALPLEFQAALPAAPSPAQLTREEPALVVAEADDPLPDSALSPEADAAEKDDANGATVSGGGRTAAAPGSSP